MDSVLLTNYFTHLNYVGNPSIYVLNIQRMPNTFTSVRVPRHFINSLWLYFLSNVYQMRQHPVVGTSSQWHHMSVMVSEITGNSTVYLGWHKRKYQSSRYWLFVRGTTGNYFTNIGLYANSKQSPVRYLESQNAPIPILFTVCVLKLCCKNNKQTRAQVKCSDKKFWAKS